MHCRPCPSQLSLVFLLLLSLAPIISALPFPEPALPMACSGLRLSLPAAVLALLLLPSALASEPLNPEGNAASFRPCMVQQQHLVGFFFLIVPSRASFACSAGVDRHQAGAGRPARRAQELGPGLGRPLQLGHDHLLPAEPRHRPVSSRPSPSSSRARGRRDETSRAVRRELVVMAGARRASSSANLIVFAFQGSAEPGLVGDSVREDRQPHPPRASVSNHPRATNPSIHPSVRPSLWFLLSADAFRARCFSGCCRTTTSRGGCRRSWARCRGCRRWTSPTTASPAACPTRWAASPPSDTCE
jgi:hypothetical protein